MALRSLKNKSIDDQMMWNFMARRSRPVMVRMIYGRRKGMVEKKINYLNSQYEAAAMHLYEQR